MNLSDVKKNEFIEISKIKNEKIKAQAIRLGIFEGARLYVSEKVKHGPVVLRNRLQQIAVGYNLAVQIDAFVIKGFRTSNRTGGSCK